MLTLYKLALGPLPLLQRPRVCKTTLRVPVAAGTRDQARVYR